MGVLKNNEKAEFPVRIEDHLEDFMVIESEGDSDVNENDDDAVLVSVSAPVTPRRRRASHKSGGRRFPELSAKHMAAVASGRKQRCGARKQRRVENARMLASLVDPEDICDDMSDLLPDTISAFTTLFLDKDKMQAWNAYVERSEQEENEGVKTDEPTTSSGRKVGPPQKEKRVPAGRDAHTVYTGEECFRRIDGRFRHLLAQKHLPWGTLDGFYDELLEFFTTCPDGVWVHAIACGYNRLLLHATAQYLSLSSKSYDSGEGTRETQVENRKPFFVPPRDSLVTYLMQRRGISS